MTIDHYHRATTTPEFVTIPKNDRSDQMPQVHASILPYTALYDLLLVTAVIRWLSSATTFPFLRLHEIDLELNNYDLSEHFVSIYG